MTLTAKMFGRVALVMAFVFIAACGSGGGGDGGSTSSSGSSGDSGSTSSGGTPSSGSISLDSAPTAVLAGSQSNANALAAEVQSDVPDLVAATSTEGLPGGISTLPAGTAMTIDCLSGSMTIDYDDSGIDDSGNIPAGWTTATTYNNCSYTYGGYTSVYNGTTTATYTRFISWTDYAISITYSNLTYAYSGLYGNYSYGPMNGTYSYDVANGVYSYSYSLANGGISNISSSNIIRSGSRVTITSATYVYNSTSAGGVIKAVFDNWTYDTSTGLPVSGSVTITGANNTSAQIVASSAGYTITYTGSNGVVAYTVSY